MTSYQSRQCCFWSIRVYLNSECVYLWLCGIHTWKMLYLLLLWMLIRTDLCSFGAQCRNSQRSSWSNAQTCLKRMLCSCTVQKHRNTLSVVWIQSDQSVFGIKWNIQLAAAQTAIGRGPLLLPGSVTRNVLSGWAGFCPSLLVVEGSELSYKSPLRTQSVMDIEKGDAIRNMAPFKKIKWEHLRMATSSSSHSMLAWLGVAIDCFYMHITILVTWCSSMYL